MALESSRGRGSGFEPLPDDIHPPKIRKNNKNNKIYKNNKNIKINIKISAKRSKDVTMSYTNWRNQVLSVKAVPKIKVSFFRKAKEKPVLGKTRKMFEEFVAQYKLPKITVKVKQKRLK